MTQKTNNQDITSESESKRASDEGYFIRVFILPLISLFNITLLGLLIYSLFK